MTYRTRIPALVVSIALVLAACSSDDTPETTDTTTPDTTVTPTSIDDTTTTDPPATTATVPTTDPPTTTSAPPTTAPPATTDAAGNHGARRTRLARRSSPNSERSWTKSSTIRIRHGFLKSPSKEASGTPSTGSAIRNSFERGERTIGLEPTTVVSAEFNGTLDDVPLDEARAVSVKVVIEAQDLSNAQIVDSEGNVVFDLVNDNEPGELLTGFWLLARTDDGWRVGRIFT